MHNKMATANCSFEKPKVSRTWVVQGELKRMFEGHQNTIESRSYYAFIKKNVIHLPNTWTNGDFQISDLIVTTQWEYTRVCTTYLKFNKIGE